ncbi:MAG TPA: hypothetical protein VGE26_05790 [Sphingobacteriaceae bacterium]
MKSTIQQTSSGMYKVRARETNSDKAVSKKIILLVIVQTILFYLFSMVSSMDMQIIPGSSIAVGGFLISAFIFVNLLLLFKWKGRSMEQKVACITQLALPVVFALGWVYMLG